MANDYKEDLDNIDFNNYKGIYFGDDTKKYTCPHSGAHFQFQDMCIRMLKLADKRNNYEKYIDDKYGNDPNY